MDDWFDVGDAEECEFLHELRSQARSWPSIPTTEPVDTGGWLREGVLITYADRDDPGHSAVLASFRVDFDGTRALAARVSPGYVEVAASSVSCDPRATLPLSWLQAAHASALLRRLSGSGVSSRRNPTAASIREADRRVQHRTPEW